MGGRLQDRRENVNEVTARSDAMVANWDSRYATIQELAFATGYPISLLPFAVDLWRSFRTRLA